jgi:uncharacterized protein (TIGR02271 family)
VRVYTRVIEEPVEQDVTLREEKVRVDRQPVDRPVTDSDRSNFRDQTIEVTETAEEPVVQKTSRVVEEVKVGKEATERTEKVRDTVHRTEVRTEPIGSGETTSESSRAQDFRSDFRRDFEQRYASSGGDYSTYGPAYEYGYAAANDPRYRGKDWSDIEPDLRADYNRKYPGGTWERIKDAVQYGWYKVTGKR